MEAFDVGSLAFVTVPRTDSGEYEMHRPRTQPYCCRKVLYVNVMDNMVVWIIPVGTEPKHFVYHVQQGQQPADVGNHIGQLSWSSVAEDYRKAFMTRTVSKKAKLEHPSDSEETATKDTASGTDTAVAHPIDATEGDSAAGAAAKDGAAEEAGDAAAKDGATEEAEDVDGVAVKDGDSAAAEDGDGAAAEDDSSSADLHKKIAQLEADMQVAEDARVAAEEQAADVERRHKNYIKTKQREVNSMKSKIDGNEAIAAATRENDEKLQKVQAELAKTKSLLPSVTEQEKLRKTHCIEIYRRLMGICSDAIKNALQTLPGSAPAPALAEWQFSNGNDSWIDFTDDVIMAELNRLWKGTVDTVYYTVGSNNYTVVRADTPNLDYELMQTNVQYGTQRQLRKPSLHTPANTHTVTLNQRTQILFGQENIIALPIDEFKQWLHDYRFDVSQMCEHSTELAELATEWSALSIGFRYLGSADAGSSTEATTTTKSELWCKPIVLLNWLTVATTRGYTHARLMMHGATDDGYAAMRADPMCYNMQHAGKNGTAHGNGLYFGLSDQVSVNYNSRRNADGSKSKQKDGTAVLNLMLGLRQLNQQHNGGFIAQEDREAYDKCASTFGLGVSKGPSAAQYNGNNCVCVHEGYLVLPLGLCVSQ